MASNKADMVGVLEWDQGQARIVASNRGYAGMNELSYGYRDFIEAFVNGV